MYYLCFINCQLTLTSCFTSALCWAVIMVLPTVNTGNHSKISETIVMCFTLPRPDCGDSRKPHSPADWYDCPWIDRRKLASLYSAGFYSTLFSSVLFYSITVYSTVFYSILLYSTPLYPILFSPCSWRPWAWAGCPGWSRPPGPWFDSPHSCGSPGPEPPPSRPSHWAAPAGPAHTCGWGKDRLSISVIHFSDNFTQSVKSLVLLLYTQCM